MDQSDKDQPKEPKEETKEQIEEPKEEIKEIKYEHFELLDYFFASVKNTESKYPFIFGYIL